MIHLTRLNRGRLVVNSDLIEHIESTPDTVVALTTGEKILVLEAPDEIIERVKSFRRSILSPLCACSYSSGLATPASSAAQPETAREV